MKMTDTKTTYLYDYISFSRTGLSKYLLRCIGNMSTEQSEVAAARAGLSPVVDIVWRFIHPPIYAVTVADAIHPLSLLLFVIPNLAKSLFSVPLKYCCWAKSVRKISSMAIPGYKIGANKKQAGIIRRCIRTESKHSAGQTIRSNNNSGNNNNNNSYGNGGHNGQQEGINTSTQKHISNAGLHRCCPHYANRDNRYSIVALFAYLSVNVVTTEHRSLTTMRANNTSHPIQSLSCYRCPYCNSALFMILICPWSGLAHSYTHKILRFA